MNPDLLVFGAGLLAGTMNALAGGGSFVSLPALISVGVPSVQANASSTVGLFPGTAASAWAYRDGLGPLTHASYAYRHNIHAESAMQYLGPAGHALGLGRIHARRRLCGASNPTVASLNITGG
jgi:hypothetical protein